MSAATRKRQTVRVVGRRGPGRAHREPYPKAETGKRHKVAARAPERSLFARAAQWFRERIAA